MEKLEGVGIWRKVTGGGIRKREYAKTLADDSFALSVAKKAMEPYVWHVQARYPSLIHVKYGALSEDLSSREIAVLEARIQASLRLYSGLQGPPTLATANLNHRLFACFLILLPSD